MNANASRNGVNPNGTETSLLNRVSHSSHFSSTAKLRFLSALRYGPVKTARELLKEIPIVAKTRDNRGYTPLHYAAMATLCDTPEMVKELRQAGANIDAEDISGNTPLHYSCPKMAAALIDMNANIEARNLQGSTALHLAANKGLTEKVRILLTANANVEAQDNWQLNTPLHSAARAGYLEIVKMVLGKGANVNSVNKLGMTPLCLVASSFTLKPGLDKVVQLLLNANADMKIPDKDGNTPLHHAAMNENLEILRLLLNEGGDIHLANRKGVTVWDLAQRPGRREIEKVISQIIVKDCVICCNETAFFNFPKSLHLKDHEICHECISTHIRVRILDEGDIDIDCLDGACQEVLEYNEIKQYCEKRTLIIYEQLLLKRALESDPNFRYCANKTCSAGQIVINEDETSFFKCHSCQFKTCFGCREEAHHPLSCEEQQAFLRAELAPADSLSSAWMSRYTKRCFWCKVMVEKIDGCDHMTCSQCNAEWCWQCGVDYERVLQMGFAGHLRSCRHYASQ